MVPGHAWTITKNTKHSAECFVSSFRQGENTKKNKNKKDQGGKGIQDDEMSEATQMNFEKKTAYDQ